MSSMEFEKYKLRGAYHWEQVGLNLLKRNCYVIGRYRNVIELAKKHLSGDLNRKKILDAGCGDGVLSFLLSKTGAHITGVDSSDLSLSFARDNTMSSNITFIQGDVCNLPFEDGEFDIVVSSDVIEHLSDTDRFLSETNRVTKNGGMIVISTPIKLTEFPLDKMHVQEWFRKEYEEMISAYFPNTIFYESHPVFWFEFFSRSTFHRLLLNIWSYFYNPFKGFKKRFRFNSLQYSVSKK